MTQVFRKGPTKEWIRIDTNGKVTFIDWDMVEELAEEHKARTKNLVVQTNLDVWQVGIIAELCLAIREHILDTLKEEAKWKPDSS